MRDAICPDCGRSIGTYRTGSLNARRRAPERICFHVRPSDGEQCSGSYKAVRPPAEKSDRDLALDDGDGEILSRYVDRDSGEPVDL